MAMQTLTGSQYNLRDIIDSAIQQTDMNLSNPLIDKKQGKCDKLLQRNGAVYDSGGNQ